MVRASLASLCSVGTLLRFSWKWVKQDREKRLNL